MLYVYLHKHKSASSAQERFPRSKRPAITGGAQVLVDMERARKDRAAAEDAERAEIKRKARVPARSQVHAGVRSEREDDAGHTCTHLVSVSGCQRRAAVPAAALASLACASCNTLAVGTKTSKRNRSKAQRRWSCAYLALAQYRLCCAADALILSCSVCARVPANTNAVRHPATVHEAAGTEGGALTGQGGTPWPGCATGASPPASQACASVCSTTVLT